MVYNCIIFGPKINVLLNHDFGNPYLGKIVTSKERFLDQNPDLQCNNLNFLVRSVKNGF